MQTLQRREQAQLLVEGGDDQAEIDRRRWIRHGDTPRGEIDTAQASSHVRAAREHEAPLRGIGPGREHDRRAGELGGHHGHAEVRGRDLHGRRHQERGDDGDEVEARDLTEADRRAVAERDVLVDREVRRGAGERRHERRERDRHVTPDEQDEHPEIEAGPEGTGDSRSEQLARILHELGIEQPACQTAEAQLRQAFSARRLVKS